MIRAEGPFKGVAINKYKEEILPGWVQHIVDQLANAKKNKGIVRVDEKDHYTVSLYTQGVYADLALGICSGAEDYYEIQRQFDLESKKLENEKLKLEIEKLKLMNKKLEQEPSGSNIVIQNPPDTSSVQVNLNAPTSEKDATVSFVKKQP